MTKIKNILKTKFDTVKLFELESYNDERGSFKEIFNKQIQSLVGENIHFIQDNESISKFGVLRGMHFQNQPFAQSKLIRVNFGEIQDVIIDIRKDSQTFGEWESYILSSDNRKVLFVPEGFAHGFLVLSEKAIVNYKVDNTYNPSSESGIRFDDEHFMIKWKLPNENIILNDKDLSYSKFNNE